MEDKNSWDGKEYRPPSGYRQTPRTPAVCGHKSSLRGLWTAVALLLALTVVIAGLRTSDLRYPVGITQTSDTCPTHHVGETFSMGELTITVDDAWWVELDNVPSAVREGYDCMAVDMYITGGTPQEDLHLISPSLVLPDGVRVALEDEAVLSKKLKACGIYAVNLSDCRWEDPMIGQFIFYVPTGTVGTMVLEVAEYPLSRRKQLTPTIVHAVEFNTKLLS